MLGKFARKRWIHKNRQGVSISPLYFLLTTDDNKNMKTTECLNKMYQDAGFDCSIDAGIVGFVVYGPSAEEIASVVKSLSSTLAACKVAYEIGTVEEMDSDFPNSERYSATLGFDWNTFPEGR